MKTVSEQLARLHRFDHEIERTFRYLYGSASDLIEKRKRAIQSLLEAFLRVYGDRPVILVRSPARINLLGMHVDHRGGHVNHMCISREMLVAAGPREDDLVCMHNADPHFQPRAFRIGEELPPDQTGDWTKYLEDAAIEPGDWQNYVRAPILRLQHRLSDRMLRGMDVMVAGDIPHGVGLSPNRSAARSWGKCTSTGASPLTSSRARWRQRAEGLPSPPALAPPGRKARKPNSSTFHA
ncbi:MAG: galactokinase family protein [Candidatus Latescibacterota bacterium]